MKLLVIGHALIIDSNRNFWSVFAKKNQAVIDAIVPRSWRSNLSKSIPFSYNSKTDGSLRNIYTLPTFLTGNGSLYFFAPWSLFNILNKDKYDVIYLNQETWALSTSWIIFLKLLSKNRNSKLFLCVAQNLKKNKLTFLHPYERLISRFVHAFLFCSNEVQEVLKWKGIKSEMVYFPLPYDDEVYKKTDPTNTEDIFYLGYLGRLSNEKGLRILLQACDDLKRSGFNFKLIIGGSGPLADEIKSKDYVNYLGLIPHNNAHTFYDQIHCFILPSLTRENWKEQFGRVIVEAFGAGKPVIGSSSGSIPEVLGKLDWHWIYKENSSQELALLVRKLSHYLKTNEGQESMKRSIGLNHKFFSQSEVALYLHKTFSN